MSLHRCLVSMRQLAPVFVKNAKLRNFASIPSCSVNSTSVTVDVHEADLDKKAGVDRIAETVDGDTVTIKKTREPDPNTRYLKLDNPHGSCPLCALNVTVKYSDVLILRQFMRPDGTVLPRQVTGLCAKQQLHVERCVMQAHWSGLFPNNNPLDHLDPPYVPPRDPNKQYKKPRPPKRYQPEKPPVFRIHSGERVGYRAFNRYWESSMDMAGKGYHDIRPGVWRYKAQFSKFYKDYTEEHKNRDVRDQRWNVDAQGEAK